MPSGAIWSNLTCTSTASYDPLVTSRKTLTRFDWPRRGERRTQVRQSYSGAIRGNQR